MPSDRSVQGETVVQTCRQIGATDQSYTRRSDEYDGLKTDQAKPVKEVERDNALLSPMPTS